MIAVTGATGQLGGRVAVRLAERGAAIRMIVRDPARAPRLEGAEVALSPGYHDGEAMTAALRGTETLFLVSGRESPTRLEEHKSAVARLCAPMSSDLSTRRLPTPRPTLPSHSDASTT
jgi:uncharacterized protein YbjT (DUF2867 family)